MQDPNPPRAEKSRSPTGHSSGSRSGSGRMTPSPNGGDRDLFVGAALDTRDSHSGEAAAASSPGSKKRPTADAPSRDPWLSALWSQLDHGRLMLDASRIPSGEQSELVESLRALVADKNPDAECGGPDGVGWEIWDLNLKLFQAKLAQLRRRLEERCSQPDSAPSAAVVARPAEQDAQGHALRGRRRAGREVQLSGSLTVPCWHGPSDLEI